MIALQYDARRTKVYTPRSALKRLELLKAEETAFLSAWLGVAVSPVESQCHGFRVKRRSHSLQPASPHSCACMIDQ